ncbi:MAG: hypothetical protein ACSHYA_20060 [Opitutaceae bacterium]
MKIPAKLLFLILYFASYTADACWIDPGPVSWDTRSIEYYDIKKLNEEKVIEVYRKSRLQEPISRFSIDGYSPIFSSFQVLEGGEKIVHLRDDHLVRDLDDAVLELYSKDGKISTITAKELTDRIIDRPRDYSTLSTDPSSFYSSARILFDDRNFDFFNSVGEYVSVDLRTFEVQKWLIDKGLNTRKNLEWNFESQLDDLKVHVQEYSGRYSVFIWQPESLPYELKWAFYKKVSGSQEVLRFELDQDPYSYKPRRFKEKENALFYRFRVDPEIEGEDILTLITDLREPKEGENKRKVFRISLSDFKRNSVLWIMAENEFQSGRREH